MYIRRCIDYIFLYFLENYQKAVHHSSYCGFIRPIKTSIGSLSSLKHLKIFHFHEYLLNVDSMGGFLLKLYVVVQSRDILLLAPMERFQNMYCIDLSPNICWKMGLGRRATYKRPQPLSPLTRLSVIWTILDKFHW